MFKHKDHDEESGLFPRRYNTDKLRWERWDSDMGCWTKSSAQYRLHSFPTLMYRDTWCEPIADN